MSDEPLAGYQPAAEPGQVSQGQAGSEPQFVTRAELEAIRKEAIEEARRAAQSLTDKQESRVMKRLAEWEAQVKEQGITVDNSLRQQALNKLALAELDRAAGGDGTQTQPVAQPDRKLLAKINRVNALLSEVEADADASIMEVPEFADFNWKDPDPDRAYQEAERRKQLVAQRLGGAQTPGSPAARAGSPQGAPGGNDLRAEYERRKQGLRPGSEQMLQLRNEMRRKGLTDI